MRRRPQSRLSWLKGNQGRKALKWLPAYFNFERTNTPQITLTADKHSMGLSALSTPSAGRRAAVKAGRKPVHFSLDGCLLSCYFSGSVNTTSGHFVHKSRVRRGTGAFIYALSADETSSVLAASRPTSTHVFLPLQKPLPSPAATAFSRQRRQSV